MKQCWSDKSCPLRQDQYDNYANYLQSYVNYMKQNGVQLYAISMINEPDFKTDAYNTMNFSPTDLVKFLKTSAQRISGTKIMASESYGWSSETNDAILNDHGAAAKVDILARHAYGFPMIPQTKAQQMGKHVWMTEFYTNGNDWNSVIELAKNIHNCINIAQFNAYVHWWFNENSPKI
ncbi:Glucosylceramidase [Meloidogyne graminicola]|uniref:glucosylceramidase n=1 Tax=Meloidogyne graminicola TaxID=189291 RepID=A0A8S9ZFX7_9BILA|nr:Glucosylceramidase [Meloidogyne graminicola]